MLAGLIQGFLSTAGLPETDSRMVWSPGGLVWATASASAADPDAGADPEGMHLINGDMNPLAALAAMRAAAAASRGLLPTSTWDEIAAHDDAAVLPDRPATPAGVGGADL